MERAVIAFDVQRPRKETDDDTRRRRAEEVRREKEAKNYRKAKARARMNGSQADVAAHKAENDFWGGTALIAAAVVLPLLMEIALAFPGLEEYMARNGDDPRVAKTVGQWMVGVVCGLFGAVRLVGAVGHSIKASQYRMAGGEL